MAWLGLPVAFVAAMLSLPPLSWWPAAFLIFFPLWLTADRATPWQRFFIGAAFIVALAAVVLYPLLGLSPTLWLYLSGIAALVVGAFLMLTTPLLQRGVLLGVVATGLVWWCVEWLLEMVNIPLRLAIHLAGDSSRLWTAGLIGGKGTAVMLVTIQACLYVAWQHRISRWKSLGAAAVMVGLLVTPLLPDGESSPTKMQRVLVVQTALEPGYIDSPGNVESQSRVLGEIDFANARLAAVGSSSTDIVVWPESIIPAGPTSNPRHVLSYAHVRPGKHINHVYRHHVSGIGVTSMVLAQGDQQGEVSQAKLGPIWGVESQVKAGQGVSRVTVSGTPLTLAVCSDSLQLSRAPWRESVLKSALVVVTINDAYVGNANLALLHLAYDMLGTAESGVPMVRAANGGVSAVLSAQGTVLDFIALFDRGVLDVQVPLQMGGSFYLQHRTVIDSILGAMAVLVLLLARRLSTAGVIDHQSITVLPALLMTTLLVVVALKLQGGWVKSAYQVQAVPVAADISIKQNNAVAYVLRSYGMVQEAAYVDNGDDGELVRYLADYDLVAYQDDVSLRFPNAIGLVMHSAQNWAVLNAAGDDQQWIYDGINQLHKVVDKADWKSLATYWVTPLKIVTD